jgi:heptosyltransferase I
LSALTLFTTPPRSLCVLRLSAIGDVCHVVALVQAIQRQWPQTQITWVMGKTEASLLGDLPHIECVIFDKKQGWKAYWSVWQTLRGRHFDALLHVQAALRASLLSMGIRAKYRLGFDHVRANDAQGLFTNVKVPSPSAPHVVDGLMAFAQVLGVQDLTPRWHVPLAPADQQWATERLAGKPTLIIVPASSKAYKNWTVAGYAAVADFASQQGLQVVLCGSPVASEMALATQVQQACQFPVLNWVGQTQLKQLLAVIQQACLVFAPDSGPVHMATLVGTPVVSLYAHHNPQRVGPYLAREGVVSVYQTLVEAENHKPLADLPWRTRVKDPHAMQQITLEQVLPVVAQALKS